MPRKARITSSLGTPKSCHHCAERAGVGGLLGAEAAEAAPIVERAERAAAGMGHRAEAGTSRGRPSRRRCRAACTRRIRCAAEMFGLRPCRKALITSSSWCLLIGQPRSSKSTGTWSAMGVDLSQRLMYCGRGVDDRDELAARP